MTTTTTTTVSSNNDCKDCFKYFGKTAKRRADGLCKRCYNKRLVVCTFNQEYGHRMGDIKSYCNMCNDKLNSSRKDISELCEECDPTIII